MIRHATLGIFHDSYERCVENSAFLDHFYDRLLNSSTEIASLFEEVDIVRTKKMVRDALIYIMMASDGSKFSTNKIKRLAGQHVGYGVKDHHFETWLDALLAAVEEVDPKFNQSINDAWREVMMVGIALMKQPNNSLN